MLEDISIVEDGNNGIADYTQNILISIFILFFILFVILKATFDYFEIKRQKNYKFVFDILFDLHLRYKFPGQSKDTLTCLKNGVRAMLGPHVRRPAVLLLLATEDSRTTASDLATRLLQVTCAAMGLHKTEGFIRERLFVDGSLYAGVSDFWEFYSVIRDRIKHHKMVLVFNFQAVHPHAVTVLPSLTHEVFCPQSQALIVLLMNCHLSRGETSSIKLATIWVEQTFGPSLDSGQLEDLMKTITDRPALVLPEKVSIRNPE